jgi:hypothetical protein
MAVFKNRLPVNIQSEDGASIVTINDMTISAVGLSVNPIGVYKVTPPTLTDGQVFPLTLTPDARLRVDAAFTGAMQVRSNAGALTDVGYRQTTSDLSMPVIERFQAIQVTSITYSGSKITQIVETDAWSRTLTSNISYTGSKVTSISQTLT